MSTVDMTISLEPLSRSMIAEALDAAAGRASDADVSDSMRHLARLFRTAKEAALVAPVDIGGQLQ